MPNPYFEPDPFNYNDYGLTVFQPDMVLTHKQLNTVFGFLLGQEQRTRTRLVGVGVVCGLEVSLASPTSVRIKRGCGVTTEGDLLCLENDLLCTGFLPYPLADHAPYAPFSAINGLDLWEIFPAEYTPADPPQPLTAALLADKVAMLYLESEVKDADDCTGVACDNKGDVFLNRLHVLLARKADAARLISTEHFEIANACRKLPRLAQRRVRVDNLPYDRSLRLFQTFLRHLSDQLINGLFSSYAQISNVMNPLYGGSSPIQQWQNTIRAKLNAHSQAANIQYVYDWLKDLYDAYEEFRAATCQWLNLCAPAETLFPKHLLLGELPSECAAEYRHAFRPSAAVTDDDYRRKAMWLHRRIGRLIEYFEFPVLTNGPLNAAGFRSLPLKITPSNTRQAPLGERAMPFYYAPAMREHWNYEKSRRCHTADIRSFHVPEGAPPQTVFPLQYDLDKHPFYRIEGFLNQSLTDVLINLQIWRQENNLSFDLVALRADDSQRLLAGQENMQDNDLEREFDDVKNEIICLAGSLSREPEVMQEVRQLNLRMSASHFRSRMQEPQDYFEEMCLGENTGCCIYEKLQTLQKVKDAWGARMGESTFGDYLRVHPGIEHLAGVPRGGTFILVYKNSPHLSPRPVVVADFCLPYLCCGSGGGITINLPQPPPSVTLPRNQFCLGQDANPVTIEVSPPGGQLSGPGVSGGRFTPAVAGVGTHTITYTIADGQQASTIVEVATLADIGFKDLRITYRDNTLDNQIRVLAETDTRVLFDPPSLTFSLVRALPTGTGLRIEFGDGASHQITSTTAFSHTYSTLEPHKPERFILRLIISNELCGERVIQRELEMELDGLL